MGTAQAIDERRARAIALAYSHRNRLTKFFGAAKTSDFVYAMGYGIHLGYTEQRVWMETRQREVKFLSTERALTMHRIEPPAPDPFTEASLDYLVALGELADCPTCTGLGKTTCKTCKGQARIKCPRCTHLANYTPPCDACHGTRFVGQVPCDTCKGTGQEVPCRECKGERIIACPDCVGVGLRTCETCDGLGKVYRAEVETVKYASTKAVDWHVAMPSELLSWLYGRLPLIDETHLDKTTGPTEVLDAVRLQYAGTVEIVHLRRLLKATVAFCNGEFFKLPRGARKELPAFLQPPA